MGIPNGCSPGSNEDACFRTRAVVRSREFSRTSLLDAIEMSLTQMKRINNTRKAIIILSDGGDNHSRATELAIKKAVREADVKAEPFRKPVAPAIARTAA
jgi:hypothetical protein